MIDHATELRKALKAYPAPPPAGTLGFIAADRPLVIAVLAHLPEILEELERRRKGDVSRETSSDRVR